jgi:hypothetical protein
MNVSNTAIKFAEKNGISIPEFVKFLASPAGYMLSKAFDAIESQTNLPQGILSLAQNPVSGATDYLKTQANNAIYNQNEPSKIESIISELQGTNPDKPNYVGPQEVDSPLSQLNTSNLSRDLGVMPTGEFAGASSNEMNDDLRSGLYGTQTENFPNFVGPLSENSPAFLSDLSFLPADLGVQPTTAVTPSTSNTSSNSNLSGITPEILQAIAALPVEGKSLQEDMSNISGVFGTSTPESLGFTEEQSMPEMQEFYGGGGGKGNIEDYSYSMYRHGGQIYGGRR